MSERKPIEPGSPEWEARVVEMLAAEAGEPLAWWYLSFADEQEFLGCAVVEAHGLVGAVREAHARGINPGGEVQALPLEEDLLMNVPPELRNRLITLNEMEAAGWV